MASEALYIGLAKGQYHSGSIELQTKLARPSPPFDCEVLRPGSLARSEMRHRSF